MDDMGIPHLTLPAYGYSLVPYPLVLGKKTDVHTQPVGMTNGRFKPRGFDLLLQSTSAPLVPLYWPLTSYR
jgi:hypothetical protein